MFPVVRDIDANVRLRFDNVIDGTPHHVGKLGGKLLAGILNSTKADKELRRSRQASNVGGDNPILA